MIIAEISAISTAHSSPNQSSFSLCHFPSCISTGYGTRTESVFPTKTVSMTMDFLILVFHFSTYTVSFSVRITMLSRISKESCRMTARSTVDMWDSGTGTYLVLLHPTAANEYRMMANTIHTSFIA